MVDRSVTLSTRPQLVSKVERDGCHFASIDCAVVVETVVTEVLHSSIAVVARLPQQLWCAGRRRLFTKRWEALLCGSRAT